MKKEYKQSAWIYISQSDVAGRHLGILRLGDNESRPNTQYHKNKEKVDLEFLFLLHVNDGDSCGGFCNTAFEKLS